MPAECALSDPSKCEHREEECQHIDAQTPGSNDVFYVLLVTTCAPLDGKLVVILKEITALIVDDDRHRCLWAFTDRHRFVNLLGQFHSYHWPSEPLGVYAVPDAILERIHPDNMQWSKIDPQ
jgi:hypothetical protein